jgi:hypothetical protein
MKQKKLLSLATTVLLTAAFGGSAISSVDRSTLIVGPDLVVNATVGGNEAHMQFLSSGPASLILNSDAAQRFGAKGGLFGGQANVGPVAIKGQTGAVTFSVAGLKSRGRAAWFDRPITSAHDGSLGPMSVPHDIVTIQLRAAQPDERQFELPMANQSNGSVGTFAMLGGQRLFIQWDLIRQENLATAAAGAILSRAYDGQFAGKSRQAVIAFGIERPVRTMYLSSSFVVGPHRLDSIVTRTSDYGDTSDISDANADPNEIVVTARGKKSKAIYILQIGRDAMQGCSSLTFDKPRKLVILTCTASA